MEPEQEAVKKAQPTTVITDKVIHWPHKLFRTIFGVFSFTLLLQAAQPQAANKYRKLRVSEVQQNKVNQQKNITAKEK